MSANTRHKSSLEQRGDLSDLFASALTHIRGNKRNDRQIGNLRQALQLFHENRLAHVIPGSTDGLPKDLHLILSRPLGEVLPRFAANYFESYGVEFVGELFVLPNIWRTDRSKSAGAGRELLAEFGIPFDLDLNYVGWVPPYLGNEEVTAAWCRRSHDLGKYGPGFRPCSDCSESGGCSTVGELLRYDPWDFSRNSFRHGGRISKFDELGLRAGMFVPDAWLAPERDPVGCANFGKVEWDGELIVTNLRERLVGMGFSGWESISGETQWSLRQKVGSIDGVVAVFAKRGLSFQPPDPSDMMGKLLEEFGLMVFLGWSF